jgi:hypothetical protein
MADIDLKTETPDGSLPSDGFLFGADSQSAAAPSVYTTQAIATTLLGSTSLTGATLTASSPVLDLSQTWNNAAAGFTGINFNVTDTASSNSSFLMRLQRNSLDAFTFTKLGSFQVFIANTPCLTIGQSLDTALRLASNALCGFASGAQANAFALDTILTRRAAANLRLGAADTSASATVTITIASPGVVTWTSHGLSTGTPVIFSTTGALPTGITAGTTYYAIPVDGTTFRIATSFANALAGTAVNTSGSQSGTHTGRRGAIAQAFGPQSTLSTGSLENIDGADFLIRGSQSIGNKPGGSIVFQVAPAGSSGTAQNALVDALTIRSSGNIIFGSNSYFVASSNGFSAGTLDFTGAAAFGFKGSMFLSYGTGFAISSGTGSPGDVLLVRDAANTLALRNGVNAQTFNIYNTYTDASNYERGFFSWSKITNRFSFGTEAGGSGTERNFEFYAGAIGGQIELNPNGAIQFNKRLTGIRWQISTSGHFLSGADNTYDIGASGASRPRNVYVAGQVNCVGLNAGTGNIATNGGVIGFIASTLLDQSGDGLLRLRNNAGTDFNRLQFGGTTSSFPALKRSTTSLQARLADDSDFTNIQGKITTETAYTAGAPTATGYIVLYDSTGTAYKIPAEAL